MKSLVASVFAMIVLVAGCAPSPPADPAKPAPRARIPASGGYDAN